MNLLQDDKRFKEWAENAVEYCHKVATDTDKDKRIDRAFYAFQSEPIKSPEVLILAINPAGDDSYAAQYNNEDVWGIRKEGKMTPEVFMKKNPKWDNLKKWPIWTNLEKVFHTKKLREIFDTGNFMYMNVLYFNSKNIEEFYNINKNSKEVFKECIKLSSKLIDDIIKPEHIICLSIPPVFRILTPKIKQSS